MLPTMLKTADQRHLEYFDRLNNEYKKCITDILGDINKAMEDSSQPWIEFNMNCIIEKDSYGFKSDTVYNVIEQYVVQTYKIYGYSVSSGKCYITNIPIIYLGN